MLEAAKWAPNHGLTEPWRFTVYSGEARRPLGDAFAEAYRQLNPGDKFKPDQQETQRNRVRQAAVWIAVGMFRDENPKMPEWEDLIAVGCAVHNMHLMAYSFGLGAKWSSGAVSSHPSVAEFVGYTGRTRLLGFFYVGRLAGDWPECSRSSLEDKVRWVEA
jgi:nitroreductase